MDKYCICFCRVSTIQQDLSQQTESIRSEARKMGYPDSNQIVIEYKESGISLSANEREGITALKEAIEKNPNIDCVICWELSRIGRRADVIYSIRDFFISNHIQWIVMTPYMRLLDENGKMSQTSSIMLGIFTSIAETEMEIKKERSIRGRKHAKSLGRYIGGPITYGYKVNKDKYWEIDEEQAKNVRLLFELYATGNYSYRMIANELRERGIFAHLTKMSLENRVAEMIQMKLYYGESYYPPIITKELFDKVQDIRLSHKGDYRPSNVGELLCKRLLVNKHTGYYHFGKGKTNLAKYNHDRSIYVSDHRRGRAISILQHAIDPLVWEVTKQMYTKYVMNKKLLQSQIKEKGKVLTKKCVTAKAKVESIQKRIDKVEERLIYGNLSEERATEMFESLKKEKKEWKTKEDQFLLELSTNVADMKNLMTKPRFDLDSLPFSEKNEITHNVIEKVVLSKPDYHKRITIAEIYTKVNDLVYVYEIQTKTVKWRQIKVVRRDEVDTILNEENRD